jgi:hypothetical protein
MEDGVADVVAHADLAYLTEITRLLLEGCRLTAHDRTILYTPDTSGNYKAHWTRDWAYMVEYAGDLLPSEHVEACINYVLRGQRADGAIPDRVRADGVPVYVAGAEDNPLGEPNLDNGPFLVIAVDEHLARTPQSRREALLESWLPPLDRGMAYVPRSARGLVVNDPERIHSPYGFTDTVGKSGELFMESLLLWTACRRLARWHEAVGHDASAADYRHQATLIEEHVPVLWDESRGAFLAATLDCRQVDIWANAYAVYIDFPLGPRGQDIRHFLVERYERYVWHGQVRHLLAGEYWQRLLMPVERDTYQNGAYWATASGWVLWALAQDDAALARQMLVDLIEDFKQAGVCECIGPSRRKLAGYVDSAVNVRAAAMRLRP